MSDHCIVISSCDKFSDTWDIAEQCFEKYWRDCPFPIYIITNKLNRKFKNLKALSVGEDESWSLNLQRALDVIPESSIQLWLDDAFLADNVETSNYLLFLQDFKTKGMSHLRLTGYPGYSSEYDNLYGKIDAGEFYRVTIFPTIWNKSVLRKYLPNISTPWEFETVGAPNLDYCDQFFCIKYPFFSIIHGIERGKWIPGVRSKLSKMEIKVGPSERQAYAYVGYYLSMHKIKGLIVNIFPHKMRPRVLDLKRRIFTALSIRKKP